MLESVDRFYIIIFCAVFLLTCCSRQIYDVTKACLGETGICVNANCCLACDCLGYHEKLTASDVMGSMILLLCYMQPFTLVLVRIGVEYLNPDRYLSTVTLFDVSPALNVTGVALHRSQVVSVPCAVSLMRVDYFWPALLFAFGVRVSNVTFNNWKRESMHDGEQEWDCSLAESEAWCVYELAYCNEILVMNVCFVLAACSQCAAVQAFYATVALTLIMCYFVCSARHTRDTAAEQFIATFAALLLITVLAVMWLYMVETACSVSVAAAAVHAVCVFWTVAGHAVSTEHRSAQAVCLTRICVSVTTCVFTVAMLAVGRDQFCAGPQA